MKNLIKIKTGFSPKQVGQQRWGTVKDIRPSSHKKALQGGHGIGMGKIKNPLS